jgi:uncharacterized protein (TIGR01244 family)
MNTKASLLLLPVALTFGCQQPANEQPAQPPATEIVAQAPAETPSEEAAPALLPSLRQPMDDVISGGQPTPDQLSAARDAGYKTVLNMRVPEEKGVGDEAAIVAGLGMEYLSIPIKGAEGLTRENTAAFAKALETAEYPLVIHCGSGNRIGAMFALKAYWVDGKSAEESLQIGLDSGLTRLEGAVKKILEAGPSAG